VLDIRPLEPGDYDAADRLDALAFGATVEQVRADSHVEQGRRRWGAFDDGRLVGGATDLFHEQWWGGRVIKASGIAGVAVQAEQRGDGIATGLVLAALRDARDRGAAVANLYCTSSAVYRSMGFEVCGSHRTLAIPTSALRQRRPEGMRTRSGDGRDWSQIKDVYDAVARSGSGFLSRRGPLFADPSGAELPAGIDGLTIAEDDDGRVVAYVTWRRGKGYRADAVITAHDCLALTRPAAAAVLNVLAGWETVAPTTRLRPLPWLDAVASLLPLERAREESAEVWMHRPIDVVHAVEGRGWPGGVEGSVTFALVDPQLPWNAGGWRLQIADGAGHLERATSEPDQRLDVRGWSALWCGEARCAQLRQAGLLTGGAARTDALLDLLLASGGRAGILDYF
jgi:predicted acetyltransferase